MDIVYLVESGKYSEDGLNAVQKAFLSGLRNASKELEYAIANLFDDDRCELGYERLVNEICVDAVNQCIDWLYRRECEAIVSFGDENAEYEAD